jgi:hypothetical protein
LVFDLGCVDDFILTNANRCTTIVLYIYLFILRFNLLYVHSLVPIWIGL